MPGGWGGCARFDGCDGLVGVCVVLCGCVGAVVTGSDGGCRCGGSRSVEVVVGSCGNDTCLGGMSWC